MNLNMILILFFVLLICGIGALAVMSYGMSWAERHFEEYGEVEVLATWTVHTDDFETVRRCLHSGRLVDLRLSWSWRTFTFVYEFSYKATE